jgi:hypothetical protein
MKDRLRCKDFYSLNKFGFLSKASAAMLLCSLLFAACGNSSTSSVRKTGKLHPVSTTQSSVTSTTTKILDTTTTAFPSGQCNASELRFAEDQALSVVSAGATELAIVVEDTGNAKCGISGYPEISFLPNKGGLGNSASNKPIPFQVNHSGSSYKPITLVDGQRAVFYIKYYSVPVNGVGCSIVGSMEIGIPGIAGTANLSVGFPGCGPGVVIYPLVVLN